MVTQYFTCCYFIDIMSTMTRWLQGLNALRSSHRLPFRAWSSMTSGCHHLSITNTSSRSLSASFIRSKYGISYAHGHDYNNTTSYPVLPITIGQALDIATKKSPDDEVIIFSEQGHRLTFPQFRKEVDRLSAGLLSLGVNRGDRVGIWGPNTLEWVLTMFATIRIGAILVNLNPAYQAKDIEYALRKVGVKVLVAARPFKIQNYYNILNEVCPELETSSPGTLKSKRLPDLKSIIMMGEEPHPGTFLFGDVMDMGGSEEHDVIDRCRKMLQFDDVANIQFTSGTTGNPKATCLTHFHVVNNMQTLAQLYPGDTRQIAYGMTEMGGVMSCSRPDDPDEMRYSTIGRPFPWCEVKITNPSNGEIVPIGEAGELCGRSPSIMTEYWQDERKTKETIESTRWLHSGDLAKMNEDGYISIVGRIKDMISRGGENIFAVHIEDHLHKHPKVEDVQVIGVPDKRLMEEVCACVKLKAGVTCTGEEIRDFCKGQLARYEVPRYVEFVSSFPYTMSNKVQKYKLREEMAKRLKLDNINSS
ncbi:medium-chain acyl-CoA ligase ACSF2, mitochondrial-like isoform X2 [Lytechinus variegatus]|uniref:medium-chain acyl-CoA ligase ACSF2, mitochondrial-like isoform X2 n=1 Tax=Lytechinus variegatus TaxID=7654 RepID=UPI001BB1328B|nr:medium-chain acyl-CoA ligase ACSF2, mitochondrial-like isoform X2 [Lytechinus variegatus]